MRMPYSGARHRARGWLASAAATAAPLLLVSTAFPAQKSYVGPNNGLWGTAANWSPAGVPANGDNVLIAPAAAGGITVQFQSVYATPGIAQLMIDAPKGNVVLSETTGSTDALVAGSEFVGFGPEGAGTAQFTQSVGTNKVSGALVVGANAKSRGSYALSGGTNSVGTLTLGDADAASSGTYKLSLNAMLQASGDETIGNHGTGAFTQFGGSNTTQGRLVLGNQASGSGAYTISGGTLSAAGGEVMGPGKASFTQLGGTNTANGSGLSISSGGTYALNGGALTAASENIASNGSLTQTKGSTHTVGGTLTVADSGMLTVTDGKLTAKAINDTAGMISQAGGTVTSSGEMIGDAGVRGTYTQTGGTHTVNGSLVLGPAAAAQGGYVFSGGTLNVTGDFMLGQAPTSSGNISIGNGATVNAASETIGVAGFGTFTQTGGANNVNGVLSLSALTGGDGIYFISGGTVSAKTTINNGTFAQSGGAVTAGPVTGTGTISLGGGLAPATFQTPSFAQDRVGVSLNGAFTVTANPTPTVSTTNALTVSGGGKLDLANNALQINYGTNPSPITDIAANLTSGYDAGKWDGPGINTSAADAAHGLGFSDNGAGQITVKFTRYGDANLDGAVNFSDLLLLAQHYGTMTGATWDQGDFNYDGGVGFDDLLLLAQNYGQGATASPAVALAPEPSTAGLLAFALPALLRRRRVV